MLSGGVALRRNSLLQTTTPRRERTVVTRVTFPIRRAPLVTILPAAGFPILRVGMPLEVSISVVRALRR